MGTANRRQEQPFTKLEAGEEADKLPPFYIGYYQGCHYQSLEKIQQQHKALGTQRPAGVGVQHGDGDGHVAMLRVTPMTPDTAAVVPSMPRPTLMLGSTMK